MSAYIGHAATVAALTHDLPPVTLLLGPTSVGKWTLCQHLAEHHRVGMADRFLAPDGLTAATARAIVAFVATAGFGPIKLVTARLDTTTETALNILLKTLEEPPPTARFILTATTWPLATIASRAQIFRTGLLDPGEVEQILLTLGHSPTGAARAAALGCGQIAAARTLVARVDSADTARAATLTLGRALATYDTELFDRAFTTFTDTDQDMVLTWLREEITGRRVWFTAADYFGLPRPRLLQMLFAVSGLPHARSRLAVRAALQPFLAR